MKSSTRILIVDDDERNRRILYEILGDDFILEDAEDGESALDILPRFTPDIILLDIMMPGIDGYEVCRRVRGSEQYKNVKIILVSGKSLTEERLEGYKAGADDFVSKPFDMDEIVAKLKVFARLKSMEEINKIKTDFLSLISHETNTPLNHILGLSKILLNEALTENVKETLEDIVGSASSLHEKITNILFLTKLKQSAITAPIDMNLEELIRSAVNEKANYDKKQPINYNIPDGTMISGDYALLTRMFYELFRQAYDANEGDVHCTATSKQSAKGRDELVIDIVTPSKTLSDKDMEHFFDPFYTSNLMKHTEGLGISLAISQQIALMHQGQLSVKNDEESGACITARLPGM